MSIMNRWVFRVLILVLVAGAGLSVLQWKKYQKKKEYRDEGLLYFQEEDYAKSIEFFRKALDAKIIFDRNMDTDIRYYVAESYYKMDEYDQAVEVYDSLIKADSRSALNYVLKGKCYVTAGEDEMARETYEKGWEKTKDADFLIRLCNVACEEEDYDQALEYVERGIEKGGDTKGSFLFQKILIYEKKLDYQSAYDAAKEYVDAYPDDEAGQKELIFLSTRI